MNSYKIQFRRKYYPTSFLSYRHMNKKHKEYELPKFSFCGFCGKELTTDYLVTHSLRFHDLTPCLDCGDWFEGLNLLEYHLQVSWDNIEIKVSLDRNSKLTWAGRENQLILQNCKRGAKRDLCDHLLAKYDGKVKLPSSDEETTATAATVIKRETVVGPRPPADNTR